MSDLYHSKRKKKIHSIILWNLKNTYTLFHKYKKYFTQIYRCENITLLSYIWSKLCLKNNIKLFVGTISCPF